MKRKIVKKWMIFLTSAAFLFSPSALVFSSEEAEISAEETVLDSIKDYLQKDISSIGMKDAVAVMDQIFEMSDEELKELLGDLVGYIEELPEEQQQKLVDSVRKVQQKYFSDWEIPKEFSVADLTEKDIDQLLEKVKMLRNIIESKRAEILDELSEEFENLKEEMKQMEDIVKNEIDFEKIKLD